MKKLSPQDASVHERFSLYGSNAKEWMHKCVLLLPQIEAQRIWEKKGFTCIYEYAATLAGMSRNKVNESLRILRKTAHLPALRTVIAQKGIFAVKPVITLATSESDQFWAERASAMNKRTLETFVKDYKIEHAVGRPGAGNPDGNGLDKPNEDAHTAKIPITMKLDPEIVHELKHLKGEGDWNQVIKKLLQLSRTEREVPSPQEQAPAPVKTRSRAIPAALRRYLRARSNGLCEHPHCTKPGVHIHHTVPFSLKKEHNPETLLYLCAEHHQIIHHGYIDDSTIQPGTAAAPSWRQIEALPSYDIRHLLNARIAQFRH